MMKSTLGCMALLLTAILFSVGGRAQAREWSVSASGSEMGSDGYTPLYLDITNPKQQHLQIKVEGPNFGSGGRFNYTCPVRPGDNASFRLELPVPSRGGFHIDVTQEGGDTETLFFNPVGSFGYHTPDTTYYVVDGFQLRELSEYIDNNKKLAPNIEAKTVRPAALPGRWQSYAGMSGILTLGVKDLPKLNLRQKEALADWVRWGNGRLWLMGPGGKAAAAGLGLALTGEPQNAGARIFCYRHLSGEVWLKEDDNFGGWTNPKPKEPSGLASLLKFDDLRFPGSDGLLDELGVISAGIIIALLLFFGVLIGPVNYFYISRKHSLLLFFLTTPLLAALGSLSVFLYSALSEGGNAKYREAVLLMHEGGSERAALVHARGIYSGLYNRVLHYPEEALLYPFLKDSIDNERFSAQFSGGMNLTGGWITPRVPSGVLSIVPVAARMGVEISQESGKYFALNTLSYTLTHLAVVLPGSRSARALGVKPGERRELIIVPNRQLADELQSRVNGYFGAQQYEGFPVIAECEGLPYLDDAGLDGIKLSGVYFYLSSWREPRPVLPQAVTPKVSAAPAANAQPAKGGRQ